MNKVIHDTFEVDVAQVWKTFLLGLSRCEFRLLRHRQPSLLPFREEFPSIVICIGIHAFIRAALMNEHVVAMVGHANSPAELRDIHRPRINEVADFPAYNIAGVHARPVWDVFGLEI